MIFGKDDLNNLLERFPTVERQTFKLWISSVPMLEEILHSKVKNASRDELEKIREHAKYYVQNQSFTEALRILRSSNLCVIVVEAVRADFLEFVSEPRLTDETDPEEIRGDAYVIEQVAAVLEVDASEEVDELNWLADGIEEEQRSEEQDEPDDDDDDYRPTSQYEGELDSDVDSLFSTLEV